MILVALGYQYVERHLITKAGRVNEGRRHRQGLTAHTVHVAYVVAAETAAHTDSAAGVVVGDTADHTAHVVDVVDEKTAAHTAHTANIVDEKTAAHTAHTGTIAVQGNVLALNRYGSCKSS